MAHNLTGKKIVVTGGARGIGAAVVRSLATQGPAAIVIGYATRKDAADALIDEIQQKHGSSIALTSVGGAVSDQASAQAFATSALQALGGELDVLMNVAGTAEQKSLAAISQADHDTHFRTNVAGPLFVTQALAPHIRPAGRVLFTSLSLTRHPVLIGPGYLPYVASKGAVEQMARVLARDPALAGPSRRITVNVVSPGPTETELYRAGKSQAVLDMITGHHPAQRVGQPHEITSVVAFLASPAASWVNGHNIHVNGGVTV